MNTPNFPGKACLSATPDGMQRHALDSLLTWKNNPARKPSVLRAARRTAAADAGETYVPHMNTTDTV
jgi:hypothetical protein